MYWYHKLFDFKCYLVLRVLFPEEIDRDYSQLLVVRPLDCSGSCTAVSYTHLTLPTNREV